MKGAGYERELANMLWNMGLAVMRAPASGGGVKRRVAPDLVAIYRGMVFIFEVKYRARPTTLTLDCLKISRLLEFARRAGGEVYVAVKFARRPWKIIPVAGCGNGGLTISASLIENSQDLESFIRSRINLNLELTQAGT